MPEDNAAIDALHQIIHYSCRLYSVLNEATQSHDLAFAAWRNNFRDHQTDDVSLIEEEFFYRLLQGNTKCVAELRDSFKVIEYLISAPSRLLGFRALISNSYQEEVNRFMAYTGRASDLRGVKTFLHLTRDIDAFFDALPANPPHITTAEDQQRLRMLTTTIQEQVFECLNRLEDAIETFHTRYRDGENLSDHLKRPIDSWQELLWRFDPLLDQLQYTGSGNFVSQAHEARFSEIIGYLSTHLHNATEDEPLENRRAARSKLSQFGVKWLDELIGETGILMPTQKKVFSTVFARMAEGFQTLLAIVPDQKKGGLARIKASHINRD